MKNYKHITKEEVQRIVAAFIKGGIQAQEKAQEELLIEKMKLEKYQQGEELIDLSEEIRACPEKRYSIRQIDN